jgi:antitoxin component YwqK of YwqJK toxin-antitoxin module
MNIIANKDTDMHFLLNEIELKEAETKEIKNQFIHLARKTGQYTTPSSQLSDKEIDTIFKNAKFISTNPLSPKPQTPKPTHPHPHTPQKDHPPLDSIQEIPSQEVTITHPRTPTNSIDKKSLYHELGSIDGE